MDDNTVAVSSCSDKILLNQLDHHSITNFGATGETGWGESLVDTLMLESDRLRSLFYINIGNCVDL